MRHFGDQGTAEQGHHCSLDVLDIQPSTPDEAWAAIWGGMAVID